MRIAVSYDNGNVFHHFGMSPAFKLYDVDAKGNIVKQEVVEVNGRGHGVMVGFMQEHKVDVVLCGGIGMGARMGLEQAGIQFYPGVLGTADNAVEAFLTGSLEFDPNAMPSGGCGCR